MARLETQINQIYLTDPASKKTSVILHDEAITASAHLFLLAELSDLKKKSEANDLKKISEIILASFQNARRLAAEDMFESALSQINQNLADLAHDGHKSWVGKFSCVLCLKSGENIYVANDGQAGAWLLRKSQLLEVLAPEKRGTHPLKTFVNFTQGKLHSQDSLIIANAGMFNYISLENFTNILTSNELEQACLEVSSILQDSVTDEQGFAGFFLGFGKPAVGPAVSTAAAVYSPLPEEEPETKESWKMPAIPALPSIKLSEFKIPKVSLPTKLPEFKLPDFSNVKFNFNFRIPRLTFFNNLSKAGKFFFISFTIFLIIFVVNLSTYLVNRGQKKTAERVSALVQQINQKMTDAQSAVIYKNNDQALAIINEAQSDFETLRDLSPEKAKTVEARLENIKTQINKVSTVENPQLVTDLRHSPIYLGKAPTAFVFAGTDSNSISRFDTSLRDFFLLNSTKGNINGTAFMPQVGILVASGNEILRIDEDLQQLERVVNFDGGSADLVRAWGNNLLALDKTKGQIMRIALNKGVPTATSIAAVSDSANIRDIGGDGDLWTLTADKLTKISGGRPTDIKLPNVTDGINNANKIFVGSNIYILEASKRRIVVVNKTGVLQNQIYFPTLTNLKDFYVDEAKRSIYLLDDNKLFKITL